MDELKQDILDALEGRAIRKIQTGNLGAYETAGDECYVIEFTGEPYALPADQDQVEGVPDYLPAGSTVVKGFYWNPVGGAPRWYTPPPVLQRTEKTFRVRCIVNPDLAMETPSKEVALPNTVGNYTRKTDIISMGAKRVSIQSHEQVQAAMAERVMLEHYENNLIVITEEEEEEEEEEEVDDC